MFCIALQFYTRIPIPSRVGFEAAWLQHATRYFPLIGYIVAAITAAVYMLSIWLWPQPVAVLLSMACGIYLTGAFHEDGFADMCDGMGGGITPERVLEIMKDSRIGAYGAIGIGLLLGFKYLLLSNLPPHEVVLALLIAHPLSRMASCAVIWRLDYARHEGKAKPLAQDMSNGEFVVAAVTGCLPVLLIGMAGWLPWSSIIGCLLGAALTTLWLARKFLRRIGGYTGDCLGAVQQAAEVACYLALLANFAR
ncbi:MAG: adenosylcobinamide-GDP ribazoletransferase [Pseudomonadota bacterium]